MNTGRVSPEQRRYGVGKGRGYGWEAHDERFDAAKHPNEPNRFGWVVEIDPYEPQSKPVKRTALGRMKHEGAHPSVGTDGRIAFYMGDDEGFEYIYKFVTARAWDPANRAANRSLLDDGVLYAARFNADGTGDWLALEHGKNGLTAANGFASQADVLVKTRQSADRVGATPMDRPEWGAVHPVTREVYMTLTNNSARGRDKQPGPDAANPRANNVFGHIIRWREDGDDVAATRFRWDIFALGGVPENADPAKRGRFKGDAFGCPDGLWFDRRGVLWVQTDISPTGAPARRLRAARQQPDARGRPRHRRVPAVPRRPARLRDHRFHDDTGQPHGIRQHPAPGREPGRDQRSGLPARELELAGLRSRTAGRARPPS